MKERLAVKIIHGVYWSQTLQEDKDTPGCHFWLSDGRLQAENEGLIIALQDGVVLTRHYRACVLKRQRRSGTFVSLPNEAVGPVLVST